MAYALIAHVGNSLGTDSGTTTPGINTTGANLIIFATSCYAVPGNIDADHIADNKSNSYTELTGQTSDSNEGAVRIFYAYAPTVGSGHTFTVTSGSGIFISACVAAFSGAVASPFDVENGFGSTGSVSTLQPGSVSPAETQSLIVTAWGGDMTGQPLAIDGSYAITDQVDTVAATSYAGALAYWIQTSASATNPTWSGFTSHGSTAIAVFKDSGVVAGSGGVFPGLITRQAVNRANTY